MNNLKFRSKADLFFRNPKNRPHIPGENGVLYLLRRDILACLGYDLSNNFKKSNNPVLFPAGMAILAGVDLLAKFYKGSDETGGVTARFEEFVRKYFKIDSCGDEEIIYQLRNSLLHSFGLYSRKGTNAYHFILVSSGEQLVHKRSIATRQVYQVDLITLSRRFEDAIEKYSDELKIEPELQKRFLIMFEHYGSIYITE